jgi:hypothetical protein
VGDDGVQAVGLEWLEGLREEVVRLDLEDGAGGRLEELLVRTIEEARTDGLEITWYAAWARRVGGEVEEGVCVELPA